MGDAGARHRVKDSSQVFLKGEEFRDGLAVRFLRSGEGEDGERVLRLCVCGTCGVSLCVCGTCGAYRSQSEKKKEDTTEKTPYM
ncbi:MAG: hypothetical protein LBL06_01220 [Treponema sp.]|nr:hypothetical protein [Treponema sp.]